MSPEQLTCLAVETISINGGGAPPEEAGAIRQLQENVWSMAAFIKKFRAAVLLFDHCEHRRSKLGSDEEAARLLKDWQMIAARDGAMSIYHFGKMWTVMPTLVRQAPTLWARMNQTAFNQVGGSFEQGFPQWALVRKGIAHMGDFRKAANRVAEHVTADDILLPDVTVRSSAETYVSDCLSGRTYVSTVEGKVVRYDISNETLGSLCGVYDLIVEAFRPVSAP